MESSSSVKEDIKRTELKEDEKIRDEEVTLRVRMSVRELARDSVKLNAFLRAFKRIQELPHDDENSFWVIAGYHGEPFEGSKWKLDGKEVDGKVTPDMYWGGYCQHGNILFPLWHRAYLIRLELALRSVMEDGDDVTVPYWDYSSRESMKYGIPEILTVSHVKIDGETVPNPLHSYEYPLALSSEDADKYYHKPKGTRTCRYPFSGIQSPQPAKMVADIHNSLVGNLLKFFNHSDTDALNNNLELWMKNPADPSSPNSVYVQLKKCLQSPNYTVFSNVNSATSDTVGHTSGTVGYCALEQPHNDIHLATGGFTNPDWNERWKSIKEGHRQMKYLIPGANGDMGENETAAFDPIFFFHHCNIDRMFWIWQMRHRQTTNLKFDEDCPKDCPGTIVNKHTLVTVGQTLKEKLTLETPLLPFKNPSNSSEYITSQMVTDIKQCGYDYSKGSFDTGEVEYKVNSKIVDLLKSHDFISKIKAIINDLSEHETNIRRIVDVTGFHSSIYNVTVGEEVGSAIVWREDFVTAYGFSKSAFVGSFIVRVWHKLPNGKAKMIGRKGVLDRWDPSTCRNCQEHRKVNVSFSLGLLVLTDEREITFDIVGRDMKKGGHKVLTVSTDGNSDVKIDDVKFHSVFSNRDQVHQDCVHTDDIPRVDFRRAVAWRPKDDGPRADNCMYCTVI